MIDREAVNSEVYQNILPYTVYCYRCRFFPTRKQLQKHTICESVYEIEWQCICCQERNKTKTNVYYQCFYFTGSTLIVNQRKICRKKTILFIDIQKSMEQNLLWLNDIYNKKDSVTKKILIQESALLKKYLSIEGMKMRLQKGQHFSWNTFLLGKRFKKIQYALWLANKLQKLIYEIQIKFFMDKSQQLRAQGKIDDLIVLPETLLKQLFKANNSSKPYQLLSLQEMYQIDKQSQIIIISAMPLNSLASKCEKIEAQKIIIVNLQQLTDPITLRPTATSLHELRGLKQEQQFFLEDEQEEEDIQFSSRIKVISLRLKHIDWHRQHPQMITQMLLQVENKDLYVFIRRGAKGEKEYKSWLKVIDPTICKQIRLRKQSLKKGRSNSEHHQKIQQILTQFGLLVKKMSTKMSPASIDQFLRTILAYFGKTYEVRAFVSFISNFTQYSLLISQENRLLQPNQKPKEPFDEILHDHFYSQIYQHTFIQECLQCSKFSHDTQTQLHDQQNELYQQL